MIAKRGSFEFCDSPVITSGQEAQGNYQCPMFAAQAQDAFENIKSYNFQLTVVQDALDAGVAILEASAVSLAASMIGPGGALAGLGIGLSFAAFLSASLAVEGTTTRQGYCSEQVPTSAAYSDTGTYSLTVNSDTFYYYIPGSNEISASNGTQLLIPGRKFLSQGITLATTIKLTGKPGKPVTASVVNRGFRDIYAQNLCLVMIDWGCVVRKQVGSKQGIGGVLYYPEVTLVAYLGGYFIATDITLLSGAGSVQGGVILTNSEGVIANVNALTSAGPPVGAPSMFGQIQPNERYDSLTWVIKGNTITFTGITFIGMYGGTGPTQGVFLEGQQLSFTVSADQKTLTAVLPTNPSGYVTFRTTAGDVYMTRTPI
jgi:hypothetical protein